MPLPNVIGVVVERLHAGLLGVYGNSWIGTRAIDALACESFVFDQAVLESPRLDAAYRSLWCGQHAAVGIRSTAAPAGTAVSGTPGALPAELRAAGYQTALLTDSPEVAALAAPHGFAEVRTIDDCPARSAKEPGETSAGRLFAAASAWLATARQPFFLWIHARGLAGPWDAPLALRNRFAEEDDPTPPALVETPDYWLPDECDPDEPLGIKHAAAGQVTLIDTCLGQFLDALAATPFAAHTQLSLLSTAGFPLGEHRRIGRCDDSLYNETTQLVWMMRFPDQLGRLARSQALVQPSDYPPAIRRWLSTADSAAANFAANDAEADDDSVLAVVRGERQTHRTAAYLVGPHDRALRTPAWHLRQPLTGAAELYAKPSDRWEVNEVAKLLPDIVLGMQAALDAGCPADGSVRAQQLDAMLVEPLD